MESSLGFAHFLAQSDALGKGVLALLLLLSGRSAGQQSGEQDELPRSRWSDLSRRQVFRQGLP